MNWHLADRTARMQSSVIREILKLADGHQVLSLAGGLPASAAFPAEALAEATQRALQRADRRALQYGASEGITELRDWVVQQIGTKGRRITREQVLITTGSQQALDLLGKVLLQPGRRLGVEQPSYLGALQAFQVFEPEFVSLASDALGVCADGLAGCLSYLIPNYQNPTGLCLPEARRQEIADRLLQSGGSVIEDDPYGELWFNAPPPPSLAACCPEHVVYLGSFSKVLAPGLRLGYMVLPDLSCEATRELAAKLIQAKQASDLHTSTLSQSVALELIRSGWDWGRHLDEVRSLYRQRRDQMAQALRHHLPSGWEWQVPDGGMFFWLQGPIGLDTQALLPAAVQAGVAFVPGTAFHTADTPRARATMRLSFVTLDEAQLNEAVVRLGACLHAAQAACRPANLAA